MLVVSSNRPLDRADRFKVYLPETVVQQLLKDTLPSIGYVSRNKATTIFVDLSGFTAMSETLAVFGDVGIEELNAILQSVLSPIIEVVHEAGGAIGHFYGDAVLAYFCGDSINCQRNAVKCAYEIERLSRRFKWVTAILHDAFEDFRLSLKIGVGFGECVTTLVGSAETGMEYIVTGPAVDEAAAMLYISAETERVALGNSLAHLEAYGSLVSTSDWQACAPQLQRNSTNLTTENEQQAERIIEAARHFIPSTVYRRINAGFASTVAEHCPVANIFVGFEGISYDDPDFGDLMQRYYLWAQEIITRFCPRSGRVNRVLTCSKGMQLHIIIGAPEPLHDIERAMQCAMALQREMPAYITSQRIGITICSAFACTVGSDQRQEYTVIGDAVNLAARLMQMCEPNQLLTNDESVVDLRHLIKFKQHPRRKVRGKASIVSVCEPLHDIHDIETEAYCSVT